MYNKNSCNFRPWNEKRFEAYEIEFVLSRNFTDYYYYHLIVLRGVTRRIQQQWVVYFNIKRENAERVGWKELKASLTWSQLENIFTSDRSMRRRRAPLSVVRCFGANNYMLIIIDVDTYIRKMRKFEASVCNSGNAFTRRKQMVY